MSKDKRYGIHVEAFLRTNKLIDKEGMVYLDEHPLLDEAVCLINELCGRELRRREEAKPLEGVFTIKNKLGHKINVEFKNGKAYTSK